MTRTATLSAEGTLRQHWHDAAHVVPIQQRSAPTDGSFGWPISTSAAHSAVRMRFGCRYHDPAARTLQRYRPDNLTLSSTPTGNIPFPHRLLHDRHRSDQTAVVTGGAHLPGEIDGPAEREIRDVRAHDIACGLAYGGRPNRGDRAAQPVCSYAE
jgi:hypothetical protein